MNHAELFIAPEFLASIATFVVVMIGFIIMIAGPFGVAPKVIRLFFRFGSAIVLAGVLWSYFPILEEMLKNARTPLQAAILLGGAFALLIIFLSFIFGSDFTGRVVAGLVVSSIVETIKWFVRFFYGGFRLLFRPFTMRWRD